jgi:hypothetical protein
VVSATPQPLYPRERELVPILQEAEWVLGPVWMWPENIAPIGFRTPDHPPRIESPYRLRYLGLVIFTIYISFIYIAIFTTFEQDWMFFLSFIMLNQSTNSPLYIILFNLTLFQAQYLVNGFSRLTFSSEEQQTDNYRVHRRNFGGKRGKMPLQTDIAFNVIHAEVT